MCRCAGGDETCTRVWCGLPDCSRGADCRADEVCVPAARELCLRGPCRAPAECRRAAGRRVEPPALPAPPACWPAPAPAPSVPAGCLRGDLELEPALLPPGAHAEAVCGELRRALSAALVSDTSEHPDAPELVLLCDAGPRGVLLSLWAGGDEVGRSAVSRAAGVLRAVRGAGGGGLLGAVQTISIPVPLPAPAASAPAPPAALLCLAALVPLCVLGALAAAWWLVRRRRRPPLPAPSSCTTSPTDDKTTNLQNEENLRRHARVTNVTTVANNAPPPCRHHKCPHTPHAPPESLTVLV